MSTLLSKQQRAQSDEYHLPYHHFISFNPEKLTFQSYKRVMFALGYSLGNILIFRELKKNNPKTWCDVGCGDGALISTLSNFLPSTNCQGIDYDEKAISLARHISPKGNFVVADITNDQLSTFDAVTAVEVFEHIPPEFGDDFIRSLGRLVKKNGSLILTVPHKNQGMASKHYRHFTTKELSSILKANLPDFEIISAYGFNQKNWLENVNKGLLQTKHFFLEIPWLNKKRLSMQLNNLPAKESKALQTLVHLKRTK